MQIYVLCKKSKHKIEKAITKALHRNMLNREFSMRKIWEGDFSAQFPNFFTGLRPFYLIFFTFLLISFEMKNNDDMWL